MDRKYHSVTVRIYPIDRSRSARTEIGQGMGIVMELVGSYGLWIVLAAVFLTMHWFGTSCCGGGHEHRTPQGSRRPSEDEPDSGAAVKEAKE